MKMKKKAIKPVNLHSIKQIYFIRKIYTICSVMREMADPIVAIDYLQMPQPEIDHFE